MNKIIKIKNSYLPAILITNYLICRHMCLNRLPTDCVRYENIYDLYERLTNLIINSSLIFYVNKTRKSIKFNRKYVFYFILTILSNLMFSYVSSIDLFKSSLTPRKDENITYNMYTTILYISTLSIPIIVVSYNFLKDIPKIKDVMLRIIITAWYTAWSILMYNDFGSVHLHHRLFSFILCLWCYQHKTLTKILFFASLGIFIQGSIVYPYTELIDSASKESEPVITETITEVIIYKCEINYEDICDYCYR